MSEGGFFMSMSIFELDILNTIFTSNCSASIEKIHNHITLYCNAHVSRETLNETMEKLQDDGYVLFEDGSWKLIIEDRVFDEGN